MRRCPYCAEDIEDDATRCPHCGSDLTAAPPAAATPTLASDEGPSPTVVVPSPAGVPPPLPAEWSAQGGSWGATRPTSQATPGPVQFSHTGQRYLLGYDPTHFGIWDRSSPGTPVERFPRTDDGWSQAWRRYASLEPSSQPVQAAAAQGAYGASHGSYGGPAAQATVPWQQSGQGSYQQPYQHPHQTMPASGTNGMSIAALVLGLVGLLTFWFVAIPNILAIVFGFIGRNQIRQSGGRQQGDGMAITGIVLGIIGAVIFVIFLAANVNSNNF